jgi:hypothetical protein
VALASKTGEVLGQWPAIEQLSIKKSFSDNADVTKAMDEWHQSRERWLAYDCLVHKHCKRCPAIHDAICERSSSY